MHELSIAMSIVDAADKEVHKAQASRVDDIVLEIGKLAGIEFDALDFAWPIAIKESVLAGANRHIDIINGRGHCLECGHEFDLDDRFDPCPNCSNQLIEIIKGKELKIKSLTVS
jgi:hydrogenase nickel incorporation protein HypA/HybF